MLSFKSYIHQPRLILNGLQKRLFKLLEPFMSDEAFLKMIYPFYIGERLNLCNPQTFNEKIQWLKLYYFDERFTCFVDKARVKEYVEKVIGSKYVIPTIGVWNDFNDINFNLLPNRFVLKTTHGGGGDGVVICDNKSKLDFKSARKKLSRNLREDISSYFKEWPYRNVPRKIIAEELVVMPEEQELLDYKLLCFNGSVRCAFVGSNRFKEGGVRTTYYDRNWKRLPFERSNPSEIAGIEKPKHFEEMVDIAEKLSIDIPFVRIDFYEANNQIYFGEMTFFPGSGFLAFNPKEWDKKLGDWLDLPDRNRF